VIATIRCHTCGNVGDVKLDDLTGTTICPKCKTGYLVVQDPSVGKEYHKLKLYKLTSTKSTIELRGE
jgi:hypothetical protein